MTSRARVEASRHGTLVIRFHWNGPVWEGTKLPDSPANRAALRPLCDRITDELARGIFDARRYLAYFPEGNRARGLTETAKATPLPALRDYAEEWLERLRLEGARKGTVLTYRRDFQTYVLGCRLPDGTLFGNLRLDEITPARLLALRTELRRRVSVSTVRCVMSGGLRSALRDARHVGLVAGPDPFVGLPRLPRQQDPQPDPFSAEERDQILGWFGAERPHYWPFVLTLFHTGMRPSEACARKLADFDRRSARLRIDSSRVAGEENAPKTAGSLRTLSLVPVVARALDAAYPLHPLPDAYLFTTAGTGEPIDQKRFARSDWAAAIRALKLRPRRRALYATRHTFLSIAVSLGRNFLWLSNYCGTSARMIERHYAMYLSDSGGDQLEALATEAEKSQPPASQGVGFPRRV